MDITEAEYRRLTEDLFRRFPSVQKGGFSGGAYKPGLQNMKDFAAALGNPQDTYRTIHVAGTNGKGSVCNMLASVLRSAGYKVGLYTSPHILDFRERMRVDGEMPPKEWVTAFIKEWMPWFDSRALSFFEITTGMAFKWFAESGVDAAVIETGLGGRLDSTNIIDPDLAIVTSIGYDHCDLLGSTLAGIAAEKAGIFKPGVPALVGETDGETAPVFDSASWMFCPLTYADRAKPSLGYRQKAILSRMDMKGEYQAMNLRTVLVAVDILKGMSFYHRLRDDGKVEDGIIHAASAMHFRGRWERLSLQPYVITDIGHNPPALKHNFAQLEALVKGGSFGSLIIVYGIMADKDLSSILPLMPVDATYVFTAPDTPRALPAENLLSACRAYRQSKGLSSERLYCAESVRDGVRMALSLAQVMGGSVPPLVYIGGSTFVVAEAVKLF